jgi:heme-degrading monooxygenase HmoA
MENAPVITLRFTNIAPGANADVVERYKKWRAEVYIPLNLKSEGVTGSDQYRLIHETPEYPQVGGITHRQNMGLWKAATDNQLVSDVQNEYIVWEKRGIIESIWSAAYQLIKGFRSGQASLDERLDTHIDNAPIMHLEAYRLSADNQEKYYNWFSESGCKIFIPLFMNLPGLKGYDWYKFTGLMRSREVRVQNYPAYLSVVYFDNIDSFNNFEKSREQTAFQKALRAVFPRGPEYEWYVQYEFTNTWRK